MLCFQLQLLSFTLHYQVTYDVLVELPLLDHDKDKDKARHPVGDHSFSNFTQQPSLITAKAAESTKVPMLASRYRSSEYLSTSSDTSNLPRPNHALLTIATEPTDLGVLPSTNCSLWQLVHLQVDTIAVPQIASVRGILGD
jgi:hypothetical protein